MCNICQRHYDATPSIVLQGLKLAKHVEICIIVQEVSVHMHVSFSLSKGELATGLYNDKEIREKRKRRERERERERERCTGASNLLEIIHSTFCFSSSVKQKQIWHVFSLFTGTTCKKMVWFCYFSRLFCKKQTFVEPKHKHWPQIHHIQGLNLRHWLYPLPPPPLAHQPPLTGSPQDPWNATHLPPCVASKASHKHSWIAHQMDIKTTLEFLLLRSDFKSETSFGFPSQNKTRQDTWILCKLQNGLVTLVFEKRRFPDFLGRNWPF